ncbi:hypothetical protein C6P45_001965 [Maudiozyma exigua]|uniref:Uncharacterized protein n=1 Tax=Maudiozyma exigua TaxID=34358 RepID=A0A9P6WHM1_MAUEX|nr:hypothetical protein C6P45_001965 [Kazachstania exigua]
MALIFLAWADSMDGYLSEKIYLSNITGDADLLNQLRSTRKDHIAALFLMTTMPSIKSAFKSQFHPQTIVSSRAVDDVSKNNQFASFEEDYEP